MNIATNTNTLILTPNQRLAATLTQQYENEQKEHQHAWKTPKILPFSIWLNQCWQSLSHVTNKRIVSAQEEMVMWHQVINQHAPASLFLNSLVTSQQCQQAYDLVTQWELDMNDDAFHHNENARLFRTFVKAFESLCEKHKVYTSSAFIDTCIEHQDIIASHLPDTIVLYQFLSLSPKQTQLFDALHTKVIHQTLPSHEQTPKTHAYNTSEEELEAMASWAKQTIEKHPDTSIGCVVHNLNQIRPNIERVFREVFSEYTSAPPIDFSAGKPLSDYAIVNSALLFLRLYRPQIPFETLSNILRSPYLFDAESSFAIRHTLDATLRETLAPDNSLKNIIHALKRIDAGNTLAERFENLYFPSSLSPSAFASHCLSQLTALGWPGERVLNSTEYQVCQRFIQLLDQFTELDHILPKISFHKGLMYLQHLCRTTMFQPQSPKTAIQILGALEAAGLSFDELWVMGCHDQAWPTKPNPNPFIPYALQREHQLPHASAERELHFCQQLTDSFIKNNLHTIFSYPMHEGDRTFRPSRLIPATLEHFSSSSAKAGDPSAHCALTPRGHMDPAVKPRDDNALLETLHDIKAPAVQPNETLRGGTAIFKMQAHCPFQAFAKIRLHADGLETPTYGLDHLDRGSLLHHILELFWTTLQTQEALLALTKASQKNIIETCINKALRRYQHYPKAFLRIETKRLIDIVVDWCDIEKQRAPFKVKAIEAEHHYQLGELTLTLRVDRIDETNDGHTIVIDYKTGNPQVSHWFGERLKEPQLPLYCISHTTPVDGLLFAQVRPNDMQYKGVSACSLEGMSIKRLDDWETQKHDWETDLHRLGNAFLKGKATVDPVDMTACQFCDLHAFCRIYDE